jgi:hypothetical protein
MIGVYIAAEKGRKNNEDKRRGAEINAIDKITKGNLVGGSP